MTRNSTEFRARAGAAWQNLRIRIDLASRRNLNV
jgi:hypothetical protein